MLPLYLYDHSGITMNTTGFFLPLGQRAGRMDLRLQGKIRPPGVWRQDLHCRYPEESGGPYARRGGILRFLPSRRGVAVLNCIKTASWRIAAWGFIGNNEEALKGIEDYLPDECSGMTGELVERIPPIHAENVSSTMLVCR